VSKLDLMVLQARIAQALEDLTDQLPQADYALTFVARYKGTKYKDADIVVTDDKLEDVERAVHRRRAVDRLLEYRAQKRAQDLELETLKTPRKP